MHETNIHKISASNMYENNHYNCSSESLIYSMERFIKSVNTMDSVVMVPSRLFDVEDSLSDTEEEQSSAASSASSTCSDSDQRNLFQAYKMLVDCKEEIIWRRDEDKTEDITSEAQQFKHHLHALNTMLNNFANLADHLTNKYQNMPGIKEEC